MKTYNEIINKKKKAQRELRALSLVETHSFLSYQFFLTFYEKNDSRYKLLSQRALKLTGDSTTLLCVPTCCRFTHMKERLYQRKSKATCKT